MSYSFVFILGVLIGANIGVLAVSLCVISAGQCQTAKKADDG